MSGILGLVILALDVWAILDVIKSGKTSGTKVIWIVVIVLLPLIGLIIYALAGRK